MLEGKHGNDLHIRKPSDQCGAIPASSWPCPTHPRSMPIFSVLLMILTVLILEYDVSCYNNVSFTSFQTVSSYFITSVLWRRCHYLPLTGEKTDSDESIFLPGTHKPSVRDSSCFLSFLWMCWLFPVFYTFELKVTRSCWKYCFSFHVVTKF